MTCQSWECRSDIGVQMSFGHCSPSPPTKQQVNYFIHKTDSIQKNLLNILVDHEFHTIHNLIFPFYILDQNEK